MRTTADTIEVEAGLFGQKLIDGLHGAHDLSLLRGWMHPGAQHSPHMHDVQEAVLFVSGRGFVEIEGSRHEVGPGDRLLIPARTVHSTFNHGNEDLCFVAAFADGFIDVRPVPDHATETRRHGWRRSAATLLLWCAERLAPHSAGRLS